MTATATKEVKSWASAFKAKLSKRIQKLIDQANYDLYYGPHHEAGYPGFTKACAEIGKALEDVSEKWLDVQSGEMLDREPEAYEEVNDLYDPEDPDCEEPQYNVFEPNWEDIVHLERKDLLDAILGVELACHI